MQTSATASPREPKYSADQLRQLFERTGVDPTVTTEEGAALLGVAPQTMRRWSCHGSGPIRPTRVNGRLRWSVAAIRAVLSGGSVATVTSAV